MPRRPANWRRPNGPPPRLSVARVLAAGAGAGPENPSFLQADGEALPFGDGTFASVLCLSLLHELADRSRVLAEIHRVLSPNSGLKLSSRGRPMVQGFWGTRG